VTGWRYPSGGLAVDVPDVATFVVIGSGAGGAPAAAQLAETTHEPVVLLEAGPDYGPFSRTNWPADLLDARTIPVSHDWGYSSEDHFSDRVIAFERARVLGGCTAHNGAIAVRGHRQDYDHWVELGNPGWETASMLELFLRAEERLGVWTYPLDQLTPFQAAFLEAAPFAELPILETINDLDEDQGAAPETVNIRDGVRWNTAFTYLDDLRHLPNLTICGDALVDRMAISGSRAVSVHVETPSGQREIHADWVLLAAGAYGTPAILQRSGVGPTRLLKELGIQPLIDSPVGQNLNDQAFISLEFSGSDQLLEQMHACERERGWAPDEQVLMKARSDVANKAFDLHVFPWSPPAEDGNSRRWYLGGACLTPRSRGTLEIQNPDPRRQPRIDNAFLSDRDGTDIRALRSLLALFRRLASAAPVRELLGDEIGPSAHTTTPAEIDGFLRRTVGHYWHPQGTCKMGPDTDPAAVCTPRGQVRGLDNVYVTDCSLIPEAPRGFPMLPTIAIAQKVSGWLTETAG
jgi:choline dehydrogenase-like flavoprotein